MKMNLCRACLSSEQELFQSDDLADNYNVLTNINVKYSDGKPQSFCQICIETINGFMEFREKCISAENELLGILEQTIKTESGNIKEEVKSENDDSTDAYFEDDQLVIRHIENIECCEIKKEQNDDIKEKIPSRLREKKEEKIAKKKVISGTHAGNYVQPTSNDPTCDDIKEKRPRPSRLHKKKEEKITKKKVVSGTHTGNYVQLTSNDPTCGLCGKEFKNGATLSKHIEDHKFEHGCQLCSNKFQHRAELYAHRILHTVHHQSCHLCAIRFHSYANLEFHYRKVHYGEKDFTMNCRFCPKTFSNPRKLSKHVTTMHGDKEYICDICSKKFTKRSAIRFHLLVSHTDAKPHVCDLCGYSTKYTNALTAHIIRKHAPTKCICKACGCAYADADKLAKHTCADSSQICPVCGKSVRRALKRHMSTHTSEHHFKCDRCPATYKSRSGLDVHRDKHDSNPRWECEVCHAKFYNPSVLIKHRRIHTGEKPYACTKCAMRFTSNHNLKVHMKVHGDKLVSKKNEPEGE